jgi:multisubunit Na+/H+ antiporter MnhE subunit
MFGWLIAWILLYGLYLLLTGDAGHQELVAAALCATVAVGAGVLARHLGGPPVFRFRRRWLLRAAAPVAAVLQIWRAWVAC